MELKLSTAVIVSLSALLAGLLLLALYFAVSNTSTHSNALPQIQLIPEPTLSPSPLPVKRSPITDLPPRFSPIPVPTPITDLPPPPPPIPVPTPVTSSAPTLPPASTRDRQPVVASSSPASPARASGALLRLSNRSDHPLRVVLLARRAPAQSYKEPAHWDFDPAEGSLKGLILSLPEDNLKLQLGDILVAFAQDGSRRYWGPYVVGETALPVWNSGSAEWQLIIESR